MKFKSELGEVVQHGGHSCRVCKTGVGVNSLPCTVCSKLVHVSCFGLRNIDRVLKFHCSTGDGRQQGMVIASVEVDGEQVGLY